MNANEIATLLNENISKRFILDKVMPVLISENEYSERYELVPYDKSHGLEAMDGIVAVPRVALGEDGDNFYSIVVDSDLMMELDISRTELYEAAYNNLECSDFMVSDIINHANSMFKDDPLFNAIFGEVEVPTPNIIPNMDRNTLYVISNDISNSAGATKDGANRILNQQLRDKIAEKLGDYYILPSSKHEVIIIPVEYAGTDVESLKSMVMEVNATVVEIGDFLSDNVYKHDSESGRIVTCENEIDNYNDMYRG